MTENNRYKERVVFYKTSKKFFFGLKKTLPKAILYHKKQPNPLLNNISGTLLYGLIEGIGVVPMEQESGKWMSTATCLFF